MAMPLQLDHPEGRPTKLGRSTASPGTTGLWLFMAVVTMLFGLMLFAYMMRMQLYDWRPLPLPWQLWLSTMLLAASSLALLVARLGVWRGRWGEVRAGMAVGGGFAIAFVACQGWAWRQLLEWGYGVAGNPANSFFYLFTALHGLHLLGGLIALGLTTRRLRSAGPAAGIAVQLCARYWHFLLAVWLVLFGTLGTLTPELARSICGGLLG